MHSTGVDVETLITPDPLIRSLTYRWERIPPGTRLIGAISGGQATCTVYCIVFFEALRRNHLSSKILRCELYKGLQPLLI